MDTQDVIQGTYHSATGTVQGFLPIQPYKRRVTNIVIQGPARSTFKMYRGTRIEPSMQITSTPPAGGGDNTYDSTTDGAPVAIGPGEQVLAVWSGGATTTGSTGTAIVRSVV